MVEFVRTMTEGEVDWCCLVLIGDDGVRYADHLPLAHRSITIDDGNGRRTLANMDNARLTLHGDPNWFALVGVLPGTGVLVRYEPPATSRDLHVVYVIPQEEIALWRGLHRAGDGKGAFYLDAPPHFYSNLLEKHIEDSLVNNLEMIERGLAIYSDATGRQVGRQYRTEVGTIDLLCRRSNGDYLVVEIKRGRASDAVLGQLSRYMGWISQHAATDAPVKGLIIAHERDKSLEYAASAMPGVLISYFNLRIELQLGSRPPI